MGIATQLWVVDLPRVLGVWASRDEALLARMETPEHPYTRALLRLDDPGPAAHELQDALVEILVGASCELLPQHRYHNAMQAIFHELRLPLEVENAVYLQERDRLDALFDTHAFVDLWRFAPTAVQWPLPLPDSETFPFVGWVERGETRGLAEELALLRARLPSLMAAHPAMEATTMEDGAALEQLEHVYRSATNAGLDVVLFQH